MGESLKLLLQLWTQPVRAMSGIMDRGSLLRASLIALAVSFGLAGANDALRISFYMPLFALAVAYVPGLLVLCIGFANVGGFVASFSRDYAPLLTCTAMAYSAAALPVVLAAHTAPLEVFLGIAALALLYFIALVFFAIRTVFGAGNGAAAGIAALSPLAMVAAFFVLAPLRFLLGYLASPFFLFYIWYFLGSDLSNLGAGMRSRQHFRRMMEAAAVNPHDAEAQYQLGLIYQQRRNNTEAIRRFENAVKIDPTETDAHYQLGRIARDQGRIQDAFKQFEIVYQQDDKHNLNEILRELGATYLAAGRLEPARWMLEQYVERREYDSEGLYYYGQVLEALNRTDEARQMYGRAVESARTAPRYRRPFVARWSRLAQKQLQKLRVKS